MKELYDVKFPVQTFRVLADSKEDAVREAKKDRAFNVDEDKNLLVEQVK